MKFLLLVLGVVILQVSGMLPHKEVFLECAKELGIPEDMIKEGREVNGDKPEFKCVPACVFKKVGELEAGNKLNFDRIRERAPPQFADKIVGIIKECAEIAKSVADECEFAKVLKHCYYIRKDF